VFYVYVLHSGRDDGLYIGFTGDLRRRLQEHKDGKSLATSSRGPWTLIYYEAYAEQADAEGRERYLKSGSGRRFLDKQLVHYFTRHPRRLGGSPNIPSSPPTA
jgi:putative endonuclease